MAGINKHITEEDIKDVLLPYYKNSKIYKIGDHIITPDSWVCKVNTAGKLDDLPLVEDFIVPSHFYEVGTLREVSASKFDAAKAAGEIGVYKVNTESSTASTRVKNVTVVAGVNSSITTNIYWEKSTGRPIDTIEGTDLQGKDGNSHEINRNDLIADGVGKLIDATSDYEMQRLVSLWHNDKWYSIKPEKYKEFTDAEGGITSEFADKSKRVAFGKKFITSFTMDKEVVSDPNETNRKYDKVYQLVHEPQVMNLNIDDDILPDGEDLYIYDLPSVENSESYLVIKITSNKIYNNAIYIDVHCNVDFGVFKAVIDSDSPPYEVVCNYINKDGSNYLLNLEQQSLNTISIINGSFYIIPEI